MAEQDDEQRVVPIPDSSTDQEHRRIRRSNDRDQELERNGEVAEHNRGYDEAADGAVTPEAPGAADKS
jgi:hypothetical protein